MLYRKPAQGFTLIELMVIVALIAIMATVAVPGFRQMSESNQRTAATNDLLGLLNYARSEAVRRAERVEVRSSAGSLSAVLASDGSVLRTLGTLPNGVSIEGLSDNTEVSFSGSGMSSASGSGKKFTVCPSNGSEGTVIKVNQGGQIARDGIESC